MSWLRNKLRSWLGIKKHTVTGMSQEIIVPANRKVRINANSNPNSTSFTITAVPKDKKDK